MFTFFTPKEKFYFDPHSRRIYSASWKELTHGFFQSMLFIVKVDVIRFYKVEDGNKVYDLRNVFRCHA